MKAIFKREIRAYFFTPLGYVFIGALFAASGYYFFAGNLATGTTDMTGLFANLFMVVLFLVPVLTMRLMSEDRHLKTDQILFTSPVTRFGIVAGKYLAATLVFVIAISSTLLQAAVLSSFGQPYWPAIIGNYIGLLLLGLALIAICMFLSALTESQFIAAVAGFSVSILLTLIEPLSLWVKSPVLQALFKGLSFNRRYLPFAMGSIELASVVFFLSVAGLFIGLTVAVLEKRRWS